MALLCVSSVLAIQTATKIAVPSGNISNNTPYTILRFYYNQSLNVSENCQIWGNWTGATDATTFRNLMTVTAYTHNTESVRIYPRLSNGSYGNVTFHAYVNCTPKTNGGLYGEGGIRSSSVQFTTDPTPIFINPILPLEGGFYGSNTNNKNYPFFMYVNYSLSGSQSPSQCWWSLRYNSTFHYGGDRYGNYTNTTGVGNKAVTAYVWSGNITMVPTENNLLEMKINISCNTSWGVTTRLPYITFQYNNSPIATDSNCTFPYNRTSSRDLTPTFQWTQLTPIGQYTYVLSVCDSVTMNGNCTNVTTSNAYYTIPVLANATWYWSVKVVHANSNFTYPSFCNITDPRRYNPQTVCSKLTTGLNICGVMEDRTTKALSQIYSEVSPSPSYVSYYNTSSHTFSSYISASSGDFAVGGWEPVFIYASSDSTWENVSWAINTSTRRENITNVSGIGWNIVTYTNTTPATLQSLSCGLSNGSTRAGTGGTVFGCTQAVSNESHANGTRTNLTWLVYYNNSNHKQYANRWNYTYNNNTYVREGEAVWVFYEPRLWSWDGYGHESKYIDFSRW